MNSITQDAYISRRNWMAEKPIPDTRTLAEKATPSPETFTILSTWKFLPVETTRPGFHQMIVRSNEKAAAMFLVSFDPTNNLWECEHTGIGYAHWCDVVLTATMMRVENNRLARKVSVN